MSFEEKKLRPIDLNPDSQSYCQIIVLAKKNTFELVP